MEVRSIGPAHRVKRRIYSIPNGGSDIPIRGGLPVVALGWFGIALGCLFVLSLIPVVGLLVGIPAAFLSLVVGIPDGAAKAIAWIGIPMLVAWACHRYEPAGLPPHVVAGHWLSWLFAPRRSVAGRPVPQAGSRRKATVRWR